MSKLSLSLAHIDRILNCNAIEQVWELHAEKMREYGFDRMLYGSNRFRTHGEFGDLTDAIILTNHDQDYVDLFLGDALYLHAPMAVWSANNTGACSWQWAADRRARGETTENENRLLDLNASMGVTAGYSISFEQPSERSKSAIGLVADRGVTQPEVEEIWGEHGEEITLLNKVMNLKISTLPFERKDKRLTPRQREVLQWVADGKTLKDISIILDLNQATVEKHLRLARDTLNVDTTAQAILKASTQNQFFIFQH